MTSTNHTSLRTRKHDRRGRHLAATAVLAVILALLAPLSQPALAAAPVGQGFNLNRSDVRFILKQIKIAERHASEATADDPCAGLLGPDPDQIPPQGQGVQLPWGLRTVDGTCNNLIAGQEDFGAADTVFPRLVPVSLRSAENGTSYTQTSGTVIDRGPRRVSNLVVDQTVTNPAAVAAAGEAPETSPDGTLSIPNVAPDVGLSAPYNSWFTLFGQFFDHGLDLVSKGGNGTVFMPLDEDDPLFNAPGSPGNFMVLSRATMTNGHEAINSTTPFVDQNQTYTSHPSHQVFLREFASSPTGPIETGRLITGPGDGMADWARVKEQAADLLGIQLVDEDVVNAPLLATDPYGNFERGDNGFPLIVTEGGLVEGDPTANGDEGVLLPANTVRTKHAFLDDIAHHAAPGGGRTPDADPGTSDDGLASTYDDEMLGRHFIAGDGRANENIGLTAVHHVFHSEHNRLVGYLKDLITEVETGTGNQLAEWQTSPADPGTNTPAVWDGDRLFQAARFVTEMEYQHLVFEEFARKVQPMVNPFGEGGTGYNTSVDPAIRAEFAHAVYRFGHSMLTDTVARRNADGSDNSIGLIEAFLDPTKYLDGGTAGTLTADEAAGSIVRGMTRQVGQELDEFVSESLRNNLLGLPLDLATLNMARARDTGIPTLNEARAAFYEESGNSALAPYDSWADLAFSLKHRESLTNFVAAYGTHPSITGTLQERRAAAALLVAADPNDPATPADAYDFINGVGDGVGTDWDGQETGVNDIDLWVGGLAEKQMVFGGLLGSTFNYVFEGQMEDLQDGDRFYYLSRTAGLNMLTQLEGNSFAELVMRNTDADSLPFDSFARPDFVYQVANLGTSGAVLDDPATAWNENEQLVRMPNGTIRFAGPEHVVFNGRDTSGAVAPAYDDRIWSSEGDDTMRGNGGRDWLEGGDGADHLIGGDGDDTLVDLFGDDVFKGGDGDDTISSGQGFGLDLIQGGRGHDFMIHGNDAAETFGSEGDDLVLGGDGDDTVFGDDGDDWLEAGRGAFNLLQGDNGAPFQDDLNEPGHDVLDGDGGEQDFDAEGGDDVMLLGPGVQRSEGMRGFDWATHMGDPAAGDSDMAFTGLLPPGVATNRDRFDLVEALSGYNRDDVLRGDDRTTADIVAPADDPTNGHTLDAAGIARITGLAALLPAGTTSFDSGNILIGGGGSDVIEGRGGDDIINGDAQLRVQLRAPDPVNGGFRLVDNLTQLRTDALAGRMDPGEVDIVRAIDTPANNGAIDTAQFSGPRANYAITFGAGGVTVTQTGPDVVGQAISDGTDRLRNIEALRFSDQTFQLETPAAPTIGTATASSGTAATGSATVSWTGPAPNGGPPVTSFEIVATPTSGPAPVVTRTGISPNATSATVTGLVNGTTYTLRVGAVNLIGAGPLSAASNPVTPVSVPGAPTAVVGVRGDRTVALSWTAPSSNGGSPITGYVVQVRTGTTVVRTETLTGAGTSTTVTGLTNGTAYNFRVAAVNAQGTGTLSAASANVTPATVPGAPAITAATAGNANATVTWTAPASTGGSAITSYQIVATPVGGGAVVTRTGIGQAVRTATISGLTNGTTYTLQVRAVNAVGLGQLSAASAPVTPATLPGAPTAVTATRGDTTVNLTWVAPSSDGGSAITGYNVEVRIGATIVRTITLSTPATSTTVTGLTNGTAYNFRVQAVNAVGSGPLATSNTVTPATVPGAPQIGTASSGAVGGAVTATATWAAPTSNGGSAITGYRVTALQMAADGTTVVGSPTQSALLGANARSLAFTLPAGNYRFEVVAVNAVGTSASSARSNLVTAR